MQKVTKRSINTQIHCHSYSEFFFFPKKVGHSVNNALRQALVHYFFGI